jgi:branched-subunit amino acid ABC-type transport system permease component
MGSQVGVYVLPAVDGVAYGLLLFTVAVGLTLAYGVAGMLNLAHGVVFAAGAYLTAAWHPTTLAGLAAATGAATVVGALAGGVLSVAAAPLAGRGQMPQVLLTLGLALLGAQALTVVFGTDDLSAPPPVVWAGSIRLPGGWVYPTYRLVFIGIGLVVAVLVQVLVHGTKAGALVRASVDDRQMLSCLGYPALAVNAAVLAAASGLAAGAGAVGAPILGAGASTGPLVMMVSLVIVVLGGLSNIRATLAAALAVGELQTLGVAVLPTLAPFLLFAATALVLAVRARLQSRPLRWVRP